AAGAAYASPVAPNAARTARFRSPSHTPASLRSAPAHTRRCCLAHRSGTATAVASTATAAAPPAMRRRRAPRTRARSASGGARRGGILREPAQPGVAKPARQAGAGRRLGLGAVGERVVAVQRLVQRHAEAELVGARVGRPLALLGSHVARRPQHRPRLGHALL